MTTRIIRVRRENAEKLSAALIAAGFTATWHAGASASWQGGCTDPGCCAVHPDATTRWHGQYTGTAFMAADKWATITTSASQRQAHKIFIQAREVA